MFKTKFSNTDAGFNPNFKQNDASVNTNFDEYEVLKGEDGFSPVVEIEKNDTGHRVSITDVEGKKVFDVLDGQDGKDGYTPVKGIDYFDGERGPAGPAGRDGEKGEDGAPGVDGKDGYTPIKGTDYFTEKEVQEIVQRAAEMVDIPECETSWNDLKDKPSFANVALTGDYNDLLNTPVIPERISDLDDDLGIATTEYIELVKKQIPTLISQLENDLKYVDEEDLQAVKDSIPDTSNLVDKEYVDDMVSKIPKFEIIVVEALPAENISATAVYLLKTDKSDNNLYEEYIYINNTWELLGSAKIDLEGYAKTEDIPTKVSQLENDSQFMSEEQVNTLFQRLNSNMALKFYCVEDVTVVLNGISTTYPANSNVEIKLLDTDVFEIVPTSDNSILSLSAFPGALKTYYPWLEGVKQFSNILFDMNDVDFYSKWSQGNQGSYQVQYAQYLNCIFWSDNPYVSDVAKRTNYTLYYTSQLPLCYSSIPDNTFKSFYLAFNVNSDPNWGNKAYRDSFAKAAWATQAFSYYGARTVGIFGHDDPDFNIVLPKDCRGLMSGATAIENAGTFDAINVTNFGAKNGSWRDAFGYCSSLKNLYIKNLTVNLNVSWSPLEYDSISFIISAAANTKKITISVSPYTYNLLRPADFELATSKNIVIELLTTNYVEDKRLSAIVTNEDGSKVLSNDGTYKTLPTKTSQLENDSNFLTSFTETDPTVPEWAKAKTKPAYTKSDIGLSNVEDKSSSTIRSEITKENVTTALGYTPLDETEIASTTTQDSNVSHIKAIPDDSASYAKILKVGGMSHRSENLLPYPYYSVSQTLLGVTFYVNEDGVILVSGTKTTTEDVIVFHLSGTELSLPKGIYTLSGLNNDVNYETFHLAVDVYNADGSWADYYQDTGNGVSFVLEEGQRLHTFIRINTNYIGDANFTVYPMLNRGSTTLPYSPYFEGLRHAKPTVIKSVGANILPETSMERGYWEISGTVVSKVNHNTDLIRAGDRIPVLPNTTYCVSSTNQSLSWAVWFVDENYNALGRTDSWISADAATFTTPNVPCYALFCGWYQAGAYQNDIMINIGTSPKPYTPYVGTLTTLPIPSAVQDLPDWGLGVSATVNNHIDLADEVYRHPCRGVVLDGSADENWVVHQYTNLVAYLASEEFGKISHRVLCDKFDTLETMSPQPNGTVGIAVEGLSISANTFFFGISGIATNVAEWRAYLAENPITVLYELATPEVTDISDILTKDGLLQVEVNGNVEIVTDNGLAAASTIEFHENVMEVFAADTLVGDLVGTAARALADSEGNAVASKEYVDEQISNIIITPGGGSNKLSDYNNDIGFIAYDDIKASDASLSFTIQSPFDKDTSETITLKAPNYNELPGIPNLVTYSLEKSGTTISLKGSDGSVTSVTDSVGGGGGGESNPITYEVAATSTPLQFTVSGSDDIDNVQTVTLTPPTVDSALSSSSTNAVQNKVVKAALDAKSNTSHTHEGVYAPVSDDYVMGIEQSTNGSFTYTTSGDSTPVSVSVYSHPSTHAASMITGLANVAKSGNYNDLTNKPNIPDVPNITENDIDYWNGGVETAGSAYNLANTAKSIADTAKATADASVAKTITLENDVDLNTILTSGFYRTSSAPVNGPETFSGAWSQLIVCRGSDTVTQIISDYSSGQLATRAGNPPEVGGNGSWSPWRTIVDGNNISAQHVAYATGASQDSYGNVIYNTYLKKSGDTMSGQLQVNAPIFGYQYVNNSNSAAFIFDKPGSYYTGIGSHDEADTIYFGPVTGQADPTWIPGFKQKWKFQGSLIADSVGGVDGASVDFTSVDGNSVIDLSADYVGYNGNEIATLADIPTVNNGTLTIQQNGTTLGTFTANQSGNTTVNITASSGGGAQLYRHNITLGVVDSCEINIAYISSRSTSFGSGFSGATAFFANAGNVVAGATGYASPDMSQALPICGNITCSNDRITIPVHYIESQDGEVLDVETTVFAYINNCAFSDIVVAI